MEDNFNQELDLPPEACHYRYRIAGHTHIQDKIKLGMLKHVNGSVLKPLLNGDVRSERELSFYQQFDETNLLEPILHELKSFIPAFRGTWETSINGINIKYLCIEDVCEKFENPSVLDVKIGRITYDHLASKEKIKKDTEKYPPVEIFGFRILGMKVYDHHAQVYVSKDKTFGLSLKTTHDVNKGLGKFFENKLGEINRIILSVFYHKLLNLKNWFLRQRHYTFISSSILFVYEGNLLSWLRWMDKNSMHVRNAETCKQDHKNSSAESISLHSSDCTSVFPSSSLHSENLSGLCSDCSLSKDICCNLQESCSLTRLSMLDFAHVFPTSEEDSNYLYGLNSLISYWKQLMKTCS